MVCLPGLTRNARDFTALAEALAVADANLPAMRVIAVDLRGRGRSDNADPATYTPKHELDDVLAALDQWGIERARFVGTSRGGLITMIMAMVAPERIDRAVLNDIGPQLDPDGLARIAKSVGVRMEYPSFETLAGFLEDHHSGRFPKVGSEGWLRFAHQLASEHDGGGVRLDYDERIKDAFGDGGAAKAPDFWPAFDALCGRPVMVVRGANSDLLSSATVEAMRRRHGHMETLVVANEGHAPLFWDRRTIEGIKAFLAGR